MPAKAPGSEQKKDGLNEFFQVPVLRVANRRSARKPCTFHGDRALGNLQFSVCHIHHVTSRVLPVHDGHEARRIPSLESRFCRCWSVGVASKRFPESSKTNSGCTGWTIESWSLQRVQPRLRRCNHVRFH